jgi:hypothetical protein
MKPPLPNDGLVFDELIERARPLRDSKSIFALLLLLEREIGSEAKNFNSQAAPGSILITPDLPLDQRNPSSSRSEAQGTRSPTLPS